MDKYISLLTDFTNGRLSASQFESMFLEMFKHEEQELDERSYGILNVLFSDVDAYCPDPSIANYDKTDPFHDINDEELLASARKALEELIRVK
jgi:hypothetical protein